MSQSSNKTAFQMVGEFHEVFGHPLHTEPTELDAKTARLRINLIAEELAELIEEVGGKYEQNLHLSVAVKNIRRSMDIVNKAPDFEFAHQNLVGIADALTDIKYVVNGGGHAWGLNLDACMNEVHRSNMSKLGADGLPIYNPETGKVQKGPNYTPPNLEAVLGIEEVAA